MAAALKKNGPEALERLPSRVLNLPAHEKAMNPIINTTHPAAPATERPADKVRRLGRELSEALAEDADSNASVVLIYPAGSTEYPVQHFYDDEFAAMVRLTLAYRDAVRALVGCKGKGIRRLKADRDVAYENLIASFLEVQS